ncbi:peptidoglycan L-alanyl-D-glutamate endopeptidase CwlK [Paenibacillus sophorae]|uniref:M15 family metallopeptidase n=1 Tax=Paenibacillus sophorae TaxID=1333845 RepID=A0A1H8H937_9BACL|nr:M15 family metallopeptidase [Paenibacillus sophorae]QWU14472.1 M15 family metallopeptidase [Paenibacillus sophorae]SEN52287.1 peptidoglycan L-alanyl-D-glutamate endopeptidase CwlK [Paenibacillus sophorae]
MLTLEQVISKNESMFKNLNPAIEFAARKLIEKSFNRGVLIKIVQGYRTKQEQDDLYAQGRTKQGTIVTKVKGGMSYHNYGIAIDFAILINDGKDVSWNCEADFDNDKMADWMEVVEEAKKLGFLWGGDWRNFKDRPHFEMPFGLDEKDYFNGKRPSDKQIQAQIEYIKSLDIGEVKKDEKKDNDEVQTVKIIRTKDNTVLEGFLKDGKGYFPVDLLIENGIKVSWDNANKKYYIS